MQEHDGGVPFDQGAHHRREQPGGPAAGAARLRHHGGPPGRERGPGPRGQRGRVHERPPGGGRVQGPTGRPAAAGRLLRHGAECPVRPPAGRSEHHEDYRAAAGENPPGQELRWGPGREKGVPEEDSNVTGRDRVSQHTRFAWQTLNR